MRQRRRESIIGHGVLIVAAVIALYPFLSILALAMSRPGARPTGAGLPTSLYFGNFAEAWERGLFSSALMSSLIVAVSVVVGTLAVAVPAAYALVRGRSMILSVLTGVLLLGLVMPYEATVIPLYQMFQSWGLLNTYWALILPQIGLSISFAVLWLRVAFDQTPPSLAEAAALDGASRLRTLVSVILPVTIPALVTLGTLLFLFTWNEFLLALVLVPDEQSVQTAPLALSFFSGNRRLSDPGTTAAAAVLVALPVLVVYIMFQRRLISGMFSGAVKE
ncbi:carbohydrate ABC transporter permease [Aeromicrobium sp. CTD01-1L150]|uniref:carbohydrate ABC transporter permease n=1 Tax=Aeromicrobium sp. CTD01-1L150 TaxID=3341830 RepID=UPI0035BEE79F